MSLKRISAMLLQEVFVTRKSLEVIIDVFYFGIMTVAVYGLFSVYLTGSLKSVNAYYLILGTVLWEVVRVNQYSVSVGSLWNIWSKNLSNIFTTPISVTEFMLAYMFSGLIKSAMVFITVSLMCYFFFHFNILSVGVVNLIMVLVNLILFSWSLGIIIVACIFRWGTKIQALAWGLIFLFQPLSATFYPLSVLPLYIQTIARAIPLTYSFEAARFGLSGQPIPWNYHIIALVQGICYLVLTAIIFSKMFKKSKETGQFARNEG